MTNTLPRRRSIRLPNFDYRTAAAFFVTVCTYDRQSLFESERIRRLVMDAWHDIPAHHPHVELDAFVVMPNHVHGVVISHGVEEASHRAQQAAPLPAKYVRVEPGSLGSIVRSFKSRVTRDVRALLNSTERVWQRNYFEHVIRSENGLSRVRSYIAANPARWQFDIENQSGSPDSDERDFLDWLSGGDESAIVMLEPRR